MYTGKQVRVAVWGTNEKILAGLVLGIMAMTCIYASMGWPNV